MRSWLGRRVPLGLLLAAGAAGSAVDGQGSAGSTALAQGASFEAGVKAHSTLPDPALLRREAPVAVPSRSPASLAEGAATVDERQRTQPDPEIQEKTGHYPTVTDFDAFNNFTNGTNDTYQGVLPSDLTHMRGPPGPQGHTGREGDPGIRGEIGLSGKDGILVQGEQGRLGLAGKHGAQGPPGEKGPLGPKGPQGPAWDTDRQFKEMLSITRDYIRRTDTITQVHDQAATMMLTQIRDMEKSLGMYQSEASGAGDMLAELENERQQMNAEVDGFAKKVKDASDKANKHLAATKAAEERTKAFQEEIATTAEPIKSGAARVGRLGVPALIVLVLGFGLGR